ATGVGARWPASWLKQMGWNDVAVLVARPGDGDWVTGPHRPQVLGLTDLNVATVKPAELRDRLAAGGTVVVDLATSREYGQGHIPGSWFAIRARLPADLAKLGQADAIVATSPDGALARLAAAEIGATLREGGTAAWRAAGLPLETGASRMASAADDVVLSARERGQDREAAMREYLTWEINLVNDMASDDDHRFRVVAG